MIGCAVGVNDNGSESLIGGQSFYSCWLGYMYVRTNTSGEIIRLLFLSGMG